MLREGLIRLSQHPQIRELATGNGFARALAQRFVAGETLPAAMACVRELNRRGMMATLDHLGENVATLEEATEAKNAYCRLLGEIARGQVDSSISIKLTQLGLDLDEELAFENVREVVTVAQRYDRFVRIDMESSGYVDRTLDVFFRLFAEHRNVGVVIQSYLYRSESDLERLIEVGAQVRLVKGAYLEPATVAYQNKADVDASFVQLMEMLLSRGTYPAIATHDTAMIEATRRFARSEGIDRSRFEFQMLYGVRRDLQTRLVGEGYNMRIYVPYGTHWYPYLMRRLAERPANIMFLLGNLAREALPGRA